MDDAKRLELILEAVRYCQRVKEMGMSPACYSKALREPVHFLWERRGGTKAKAPKYRSIAAKDLRFGKRELRYDHAVPFSYIQKELMSLNPATAGGIRGTLERLGVVALITEAEDEALTAAGLGHRMPEDWDGVDVLARYKAAGIEIEENTGRDSGSTSGL